MLDCNPFACFLLHLPLLLLSLNKICEMCSSTRLACQILLVVWLLACFEASYPFRFQLLFVLVRGFSNSFCFIQIQRFSVFTIFCFCFPQKSMRFGFAVSILSTYPFVPIHFWVDILNRGLECMGMNACWPKADLVVQLYKS